MTRPGVAATSTIDMHNSTGHDRDVVSPVFLFRVREAEYANKGPVVTLARIAISARESMSEAIMQPC